MSKESSILLSNVSTEAVNDLFSYGDKCKGAGYNRSANGLHTVVYVLDNFKGTFKIQGTLELYPAETDWFDINGTEQGGDSAYFHNVTTGTYNFTGNFMWIRAAYNVQDGTIVEIRYNH